MTVIDEKQAEQLLYNYILRKKALENELSNLYKVVKKISSHNDEIDEKINKFNSEAELFIDKMKQQSLRVKSAKSFILDNKIIISLSKYLSGIIDNHDIKETDRKCSEILNEMKSAKKKNLEEIDKLREQICKKNNEISKIQCKIRKLEELISKGGFPLNIYF